MRIAMRVLVGLAIPVLAFGWLTSAQLIVPPADATEAVFTFALLGVLAAGVGSAVATGHALLTARPVSLLALSVTVLSGLAVLVEVIRYRQYNDALDIWPAVLLMWGTYFGGALLVVVGVRSLVGLWSMPDLPMLPSRRTIVALLLFAALAAVPVADQPMIWF
jgi:predicted membrane protein